jgi:hypothetical protein
LDGYTPPRQRGFVPDGKYAVRIVDADGRPSEKGNGVNLRMMLRVEAPQEYAGVEVESYTYLTFDDTGATKAETEAGYNYKALQHLLRSIASATPGKFESLMGAGPDGKPQVVRFGPALLINKMAYAEMERGESGVVGKDGKLRDFSDSSNVKWFIGREDFEKAPGPSPVGSMAAAPQQGSAELGRGGKAADAGNGTATGATPISAAKSKSSVDDLVDF